MKRIAYVLGTFPAPSETFIGTEAMAMAAVGHEIVPIIMKRSEDAQAQSANAFLTQKSVYLDETAPVVAARVLARPGRGYVEGIRFSLSSAASP